MASDDDELPPVRISAAMRQAFRADAPAALARRNGSYVSGIALNVAQWLLIGSAGLFGLYFWGWTAADMLRVFVSGIVAGIVADTLRWLFARQRMIADYDKMKRDRLVWLVFEAMQDEREEIPASKLRDVRPGPALVSDLLFGAVGLWLLASHSAALGIAGFDWNAMDARVRGVLLVVVLAPLASLATSLLVARREEGGFDDLEFRAGGRGIGLTLLAAAIAFFGGGQAAAVSVMVFVNWVTVVAGILSVFGVWIIQRERTALREHLAAGPDAKAKRRSRRRGADR